MMRFAGGVLGPALLGQAVAETLRAVPVPARPERAGPAPDAADALLRRAFPDGLPL
jgi:hypothetical protein